VAVIPLNPSLARVDVAYTPESEPRQGPCRVYPLPSTVSALASLAPRVMGTTVSALAPLAPRVMVTTVSALAPLAPRVMGTTISALAPLAPRVMGTSIGRRGTTGVISFVDYSQQHKSATLRVRSGVSKSQRFAAFPSWSEVNIT